MCSWAPTAAVPPLGWDQASLSSAPGLSGMAPPSFSASGMGVLGGLSLSLPSHLPDFGLLSLAQATASAPLPYPPEAAPQPFLPGPRCS